MAVIVVTVLFADTNGKYDNNDVVVGNIDNSTKNDAVADNSDSVSNDKNNYDNGTTNDTMNISNGEFLDPCDVFVRDKNTPSVSVRLEKKIDNSNQDSNQDDSNSYVVILSSKSNIDRSNNTYGPNNASNSIDNKDNDNSHTYHDDCNNNNNFKMDDPVD